MCRCHSSKFHLSPKATSFWQQWYTVGRQSGSQDLRKHQLPGPDTLFFRIAVNHTPNFLAPRDLREAENSNATCPSWSFWLAPVWASHSQAAIFFYFSFWYNKYSKANSSPGRDTGVPFLLSPAKGKANPSGIWPMAILTPCSASTTGLQQGKHPMGLLEHIFWILSALSSGTSCAFFERRPSESWFSLIMCHSQCDLAHQWIRHNSWKSVKNHILIVWISSTKPIFKDYNKTSIVSEEIIIIKKVSFSLRFWCKNPSLLELFFFLWVEHN